MGQRISSINEARAWKINIERTIRDVCVSMLLLNDGFLDKVLDRGKAGKYTENSKMFLQDLKTVYLAPNRFVGGNSDETDTKWFEDKDTSKFVAMLEDKEDQFNFEKYWNMLVLARITARAIKDKLLIEERLEEDFIKKVYWLGPNKKSDPNIVVETNDGKQYPICLDKNMGTVKHASFYTLMDDLIGESVELFYIGERTKMWDELAKSWIKLLHGSCKPEYREILEQYIDPATLDTMNWDRYFKSRVRDEQYRNLGKVQSKLDGDTYLKLSDVAKAIWQKGAYSLEDKERAQQEWHALRKSIFAEQIMASFLKDKLPSSGIAKGDKKMKMMKTCVEKLGTDEHVCYYLTGKGAEFGYLPQRQFFRDNYNIMDVGFAHGADDDMGYVIKMKVYMDSKEFFECNAGIGFSGDVLSEKVVAKYTFNFPVDFNAMVHKKKSAERQTK